MKNLNNYRSFELSNKSKQTVLGGVNDNGIINGHCTPDPIGDEIRKKLGL